MRIQRKIKGNKACYLKNWNYKRIYNCSKSSLIMGQSLTLLHYPEYELYLLLHYHCIKKRPCFSWFQFTMQSIRPISRSFGSSDGIISTWRSKYCSKFLYSKYTIRLNEGGKSMKRKKRGKIRLLNSRLIFLCLCLFEFSRDFSPYICLHFRGDLQSARSTILWIKNYYSNYLSVFLIFLNSNFVS